MKAAWPRLTCPVRMMRCSDAAAIAVMQMSTPTWCRNLSSVSQGQPSSAAAHRGAMILARVTSRLRGAENAPRANDEECDHHAKGEKRRSGCAVKRADEALGEAENDAAQRRARDGAHA